MIEVDANARKDFSIKSSLTSVFPAVETASSAPISVLVPSAGRIQNLTRIINVRPVKKAPFIKEKSASPASRIASSVVTHSRVRNVMVKVVLICRISALGALRRPFIRNGSAKSAELTV